MDRLVKLVGSRNRRFPAGGILLDDGKTLCKTVVCSPDVLVKDIIDEVCSQESLQIVPLARPFFALCDPKSGSPLNPYHTLTGEEARRQYQLRVFINTGENSVRFMKMSKPAYGYYYRQLKEDFLNDRLYPRATMNTSTWMAAIDIAREAHEKDSSYTDIIRSPKDLSKFMPKFLRDKYKKDEAVEKKLRETFQRFKAIRNNVEVQHYEAKYMEVYEKDIMCCKHIFRLKSNNSVRNRPLLAVASCREGIYQFYPGSGNIESSKVDICKIPSLFSIHVEGTSITLSIKDPEDSSENSQKKTLNFCDRKESQGFAIVVHTYYQLLVNASDIILAGSAAPSEEFLHVGRNLKDGKKVELCHASIPPQKVSDTLSKNGSMSDGNFLIRESRNTDSAYTLSLCIRGAVMNYRIIYQQDEGYSFQDPPTEGEGEEGFATSSSSSHKKFPTLAALIEHHKAVTDGLPSLLKMNYCPEFTGPIALLKELPNSFIKPVDPTGSISLRQDHSGTSTDSSSNSSLPSPSSPHDFFDAGSDSKGGMEPALVHDAAAAVPTDNPFILELIKEGVHYIQYKDLITTGELGSGHYSHVYCAQWQESPEKQRMVAVKIPTMKDHNVEAVKKDLKREILTMNSLDHPNIVKLLGISDTKHYLNYIGTIPVVVMEFVKKGCLRSFLNNFKSNVTPNSLTQVKRNFLLYGKQIADGMEYLEKKKVIHRDLAARNVLRVSEEHVKISDFGLAREQMENSDYYKSKGTSTDLPIYWYAPECLMTLKFSTKGDVWSYGTTLWEMFTIGENPATYLGPVVRRASPHMAFQNLVKHYQVDQYRLPMTHSCDRHVYLNIIKKCWHINPHSRPSFHELSVEMDKVLKAVDAKIATSAMATTAAATTPSSSSPSASTPSGSANTVASPPPGAISTPTTRNATSTNPPQTAPTTRQTTSTHPSPPLTMQTLPSATTSPPTTIPTPQTVPAHLSPPLSLPPTTTHTPSSLTLTLNSTSSSHSTASSVPTLLAHLPSSSPFPPSVLSPPPPPFLELQSS